MKRRDLLTIAVGILLPTLASGDETPLRDLHPAASEDAAVLETVLTDLLSYSKSPLEGPDKANRPILLSPDPLTRPIRAEDVLKPDDEEWRILTLAERTAAQEAVRHLSRQVEAKQHFKPFQPKNPRVRIFRVPQPEPVGRFRRPQVFSAYAPGYSEDGLVAVVRFAFPWSGGFHSGRGTYVLAKRKGRWEVIAREIVRYV